MYALVPRSQVVIVSETNELSRGDVSRDFSQKKNPNLKCGGLLERICLSKKKYIFVFSSSLQNLSDKVNNLSGRH
jgi:hypothetical protein